MSASASDSDSDRRPGRLGYLLAAVALAIGFGAIASLITDWVRLPSRIEGFARLCVPEDEQVVIDDPGRYVIYEESGGTCAHTLFDSPPVVGLVDPSGREVDLAPYPTFADYDVSGYHGVARSTFHSSEAGTYQVVTRLPAPRGIAIGPDIGTAGSRIETGLRRLAVGLVGVLGGTLLAIATAARRTQARSP